MAVKFKIRSSYQNDAAFLSKLCDAVQRDGELDSTRKQQLMQHLNGAATIMMSVSVERAQKEANDNARKR